MTEPLHPMRPAKYRPIRGRHVLLYVEEMPRGVRTVPGRRRSWAIDAVADGYTCSHVGAWKDTDSLDALLGDVCTTRGETTIWLLRGWTDLVLSGLTALMDAGIITWRYVNLSGRSCLVKGAWRGRRITISALPNWTGNAWDSWGDVSTDASAQRMLALLDAAIEGDAEPLAGEERGALETLAVILTTCRLLSLSAVPPTAAAAGMLLWRRWLGPRVEVESGKKSKTKKGAKVAKQTYVAPLPYRPVRAREAERHICYPMVTRQLRRGHVDGPIYCLDVRSSYLIGLCNTPLPVSYTETLHKPSIERLVNALPGKTGQALVRLDSPDWTYPARLNGHMVPCTGTMWTWLAGAELVHALIHEHVRECYSAHIWHAVCMPQGSADMIAVFRSACEQHNLCGASAAFRSVYSALVGRFAGWRREWRDCSAAAGFGPWSQWVQADPKTGELVPHRSIAGRVQYLAQKQDAGNSVPLMYGCVTAMVRWIVQRLGERAGWPDVVHIAADSLWLTAAGWQRCLRRVSECGLPPDGLKTKAIYDQAWMTGKAVAVVERHGARQLVMPGVAKGCYLDAQGRVVVEHTDDWSSDGEPSASRGVRRKPHRIAASQIIERYGYPAQVIAPGERVSIPLLDQALLRPIMGRRTID